MAFIETALYGGGSGADGEWVVGLMRDVSRHPACALARRQLVSMATRLLLCARRCPRC